VIVRARDGELWLLAQDDHARLSGSFAALWDGGGLPPPPAEVVRAAAIHDRGWRQWDARPLVDPATGLPHPYSRMPGEDYRRIWTGTLEGAWREGELAGLLVSGHGMRFFGRKRGADDRAFLAEQRGREAAAREALDRRQSARLGLWHEWFFFWDGLSLFCCEGWPSPWVQRLPLLGGGKVELVVRRHPRSRGAPGGETVSVSPFPFRAPFRVEAPVAILGAGPFADQGELDAAWEARRTERRWWRIVAEQTRIT
jgi:hypothetical protein